MRICRGHCACKINLFIFVLSLSTATVADEGPLRSTSSAPDAATVFERTLQRVAEMPGRWEALPEPRGKRSGRSLDEVLESSSEVEMRSAMQFILALAQSPLAIREELLKTWFEQQEPREIDLWFPVAVIQQKRSQSREEAALICEAWLMMAEVSGHRDVLLYAVSLFAHLASIRLSPDALIPVLQEWTQLRQVQGTEHGFAQLYLVQGNFLYHAGQPKDALAAYHRAHQIFVEVNDQLGLANTLKGEGDALSILDENEAALSAFRAAHQAAVAAEDELAQANALAGAADLLFLLNNNEAALTAFRKARRIFKDLGNLLGQGNAWDGEGGVLYRLGEYAGSLAAFQTARQMMMLVRDPLGVGNTWHGEAQILYHFDNYKKALTAYRNARQFFEVAGSPLSQGNALSGEANALYSLGEYEDALTSYRSARQLFRASRGLIGIGNTFLGEGHVLRRLQRNTEAIEAATQAYEAYSQAGNNYNRRLALLLAIRLYDRESEQAKIEDLAREAIELHDWARQSFVADEHRSIYDEGIATAYNRLIPSLSRRPGALEEALSRAEESRSQALLDLVTRGRSPAQTPQELREDNRRLHAELSKITEKLQLATDLRQRRDLYVEQYALDAKLQYNFYHETSADEGPRISGTSLDAPGIRALAKEVGPIALYYVADIELLAFVVLPSGELHVESIQLPQDELRQAVENYLFDLANPLFERRAETQAKKLWQDLIAPLTKRLPKSGPLTIIPHGVLHGLPFNSLMEPSSQKTLHEIWDVTLSPSASFLEFARQRHAKPSPKDYLVAFAAGIGLQLPMEDIHSVARLFPTERQKIFGPEDAEVHVYKKHAGEARHLLIATQGVHLQGSRRGTYLEIKPTPGVHDERLSAAEIATIPVNAELVTLVACDTDHGDALLSDERLTLTRSFLIAGAASVLATRWRIPEGRNTTRFLVDFYAAYRKGGPGGRGMRKDEALTWARRQSVERGDPAQVWAAWVLVGDAR